MKQRLSIRAGDSSEENIGTYEILLRLVDDVGAFSNWLSLKLHIIKPLDFKFDDLTAS